MNSIMMTRRVRATVGSVAALAAMTFGLGCADKGFTPPKAAPLSGKMALQITTTVDQQTATTAHWLLIAVVSKDPNAGGNNGGSNSDSGDGLVPIGHTYTPLVLGTQSVTVEADLALCPTVNGACEVAVATALMADTVKFPSLSDTTGQDFDPISTAFDYSFVGPFTLGAGGAPVIPPINLSATRFGVNQWVDDDALRMGGGQGLSSLVPWLNNNVGTTPVAGVPGAAGANPTLYTIGVDCFDAGLNQGCTAFPHLAILQPNGQWRKVAATQAPPFQGNFVTQAFNDVSAISTSEVYMSTGSGLYRFDGTTISRVTAVSDSAFSVGTVVTATNQKLVIVGSQGGVALIGNGTTFTRYNLPTTNRVDNVCITGPNEAFAATFVGGGLFRFDGTNWTSVPAGLTGGKFDLQCPSNGQAFVLAFNQGMLRWTGSTWTSVPNAGIPAGRANVRWGVASSSEIYAWADTSSGADRAFYRFNGTSWTEMGRTRVSNGGGRMWATGGQAYLAANNSRIDKVAGGGVSTVSYQPSLLDIVVTSATSAFAVGESMFLGRFNGIKWNADAPPAGMRTTRVLASVWSDGNNKAWAVGNGNTIVRWDGAAWLKVSDTTSQQGPPDNYWGVWGSGVDAWVVGDNSIIHCKIALSCTTESSGGGALTGVWGSAANNIFAVGENGRILRYNGTSWTSMTSGTNRRLGRVTGSGPNDVWVVGDSVVLRYDGNATGQWTFVQGTNKPFDEFNDMRAHIPSAQERLPTTQQGQGSQFRFLVGIGLWARGPNELYSGSDNGGSIFRFNGSTWNNISTNSFPLRRRVMGISGTTSNCVLGVTHAQTNGTSRSNLFRGVGPNTCFNGPMGAVTSWP